MSSKRVHNADLPPPKRGAGKTLIPLEDQPTESTDSYSSAKSLPRIMPIDIITGDDGVTLETTFGEDANAHKSMVTLTKWISKMSTAAIAISAGTMVLLFVVTIIAMIFATQLQNEEMMTEISIDTLLQTVTRSASVIDSTMINIESDVTFYGAQLARALVTPRTPTTAELSSYATVGYPGNDWWQNDTMLCTTTQYSDIASCAAIGKPSDTLTADDIDVYLYRTAALDGVMYDLGMSKPLYVAVYEIINGHNGVNLGRGWPFYNQTLAWGPNIDLDMLPYYTFIKPDVNPLHEPRWTDLYLDNYSGKWMATCGVPVYTPTGVSGADFFEGAADIDITVDTIIRDVLTIDVPWDGYSVMLDSAGNVLAMQPAGEIDWGISADDLTNTWTTYMNGGDTLPDTFNIYTRNDTQCLIDALEETPGATSNHATCTFFGNANNPRMVTYATIATNGWMLLNLSPLSKVQAESKERQRVVNRIPIIIGCCMAVVLPLTAVILLMFISRYVSRVIVNPVRCLVRSSNLASQGKYRDAVRSATSGQGSRVEEIRTALGAVIELSQTVSRKIEEVEAQRLRYSRFVSPEFVNLLGRKDIMSVRDHDSTTVEHMAVMFVDVVNFTTFTEDKNDQDIAVWINGFITVVAAAITANGGFVDKYIGDCVMALFPGEHCNASAISTARDIRIGIAWYNRVLETARNMSRASSANSITSASTPLVYREHLHASAMDPELLATRPKFLDKTPEVPLGLRDGIEVGIGVCSGPMPIVLLGDRHLEFTAISPIVNLAARLESLTRRFGVTTLIDESVFEGLSKCSGCHGRRLGNIAVKGTCTYRNVYEVFYDADGQSCYKKLDADNVLTAAISKFEADDILVAQQRFEDIARCDDPACTPIAKLYLSEIKSIEDTKRLTAAGHEDVGDKMPPVHPGEIAVRGLRFTTK